MVTGKAEQVLGPESERHAGVRVMPTHHEDERMDRQERVQQRGERKAAIGSHQDRGADEDGKDLQPPRGAVVRREPRQRQCEPDQYEESDGIALHQATSTAGLRTRWWYSPPPGSGFFVM